MVPEIQVAGSAAWRLLNVRIEDGIHGTSKHVAAEEFDMNLNSSIMDGLQKAPKLDYVEIMGAILHPLFQSRQRMIAVY